MNRAGLLNFWYYDEETFHFSDGKLLLRGSNGSGKSVTMQSFLPVLLDGKTSPDRLDPFGSRARRMEDYLLGEKEIVQRDERTGYLFIEFKRQETDQYITIGIGLQAKRHKQMKFWGFIINDNRRIGYDINLYKLENHASEKQKIPLSRTELENRVDDGGHVVQTRTEYRQLVNKYLFGYENSEAYEDLIKLLIQLRSPKLSKDFRPTVIYEILEAALPPLSDEDLRHLSDTIEQMDQTKQQIEQLERELTAIRSLNGAYTAYNKQVLLEQVTGYLEAHRRLRKEEQKYKAEEDNWKELDQYLKQLRLTINDLKIQQQTMKKQEERLASHKVWDLEKERRNEQEKLEQERGTLERRQVQLAGLQKKERTLHDTNHDLEDKISKHEENIEDKLIDLMNDAEEASFTTMHELNKKDFERHRYDSFDFHTWVKEANNYASHLENIAEELRKYNQLKEKYEEKNNTLAKENQKLDQAVYEEQEWLRLFEQDKDQKLNEIYTWIEQAEWLNISEQAQQEIARAVHGLYENMRFEAVREPVRQTILSLERQQRQDISALTVKSNQLDKELKEQTKELQDWKNKKDPEPFLDPLTKEARRVMQKKHIDYVPFYAAVEFQEHVEEKARKRIEAALIDSGILSALIMENPHDIKHDRILKADPNMMTYTLADYLKPDLDDNSRITPQIVDDILRSIEVGDDTSSFALNEEGVYQIGLMQGHALPVANVRYIGRNARKRFREEQITAIQAEINRLEAEKILVDQEIDQINQQMREAEEYFTQFPNDDDLQVSFQQIQQKRLEIKHFKEQMERMSSELQAIYQDYSAIKRQLDEKTKQDELKVSLEVYQQAIIVMKRYEKDLTSMEIEHIHCVNNRQRQQEIISRLDEMEQDIVERQGEINLSEDNIAIIKQNLEQIEHQLEQQGAADIRKQIEEVQEALSRIENDLKKKEIEEPNKQQDQKHTKENLEKLQKQIYFWQQMTRTWESSFKQEASRNFIQLKESTPANLLQKADEIQKELAEEGKAKDRSHLASQLTGEFYKQQSDLMEYRMITYIAPAEDPEWIKEQHQEDQIPYIEQWKQKMSRRLIELSYQGKQVNPYTVQEQIEIDHARQESYLNEQDQALYEEILFQSVGQKLRARIRRAEKWVNQMTQLMENRDTSSGLSFSIRWKPRTADADTEMDTIDLVHLLKQDPKLLKEADLEKITTHFRSKITKAKELIGESSEVQTLLQVLKEVLDYRKWFSFVLYYQRDGEKKRELNNNQFYKFSGGEKAMAMYIPLFTACYSRYLEAADDAPYIISLDEAFAGVDENNIREMFEVVEQLGFNYMMNSQVLWGDYDTVHKLSISELIRPKNADCVSVIRYHWDGNTFREIPDA